MHSPRLRSHRLSPVLLLSVLVMTAACSDVKEHDHDHDHSHGLLTTVVLSFTPAAGGDALSFAWSDPENDGDPVVDAVVLPSSDQPYALDVELFNDLEDPVEDVTPEIAGEGETHQLFFTGSAVQGPATGDNPDAVLAHAYGDEDADGLPLGLENEITTLAAGGGELIVTLRHLPPEDGNPTKVASLAEDVAAGGFAAIGGDSDAQITFDVTVE